MPGSSAPLRIVSLGTLYPPFAIGGYEQVWRDVVEELRRLGHEVSVLASDWKGADNGLPEDPDVDRVLRLYVDEDLEFRSSAWRDTLAREIHNDRVVRKMVSERQPDVAFIGPVGGLPLSVLARLHAEGVPQVAFLGDDWPAYGPRRDEWQTSLRRGRARLLRSATRHRLPHPFRLDQIERWVSTSDFARARAIDAGVTADRIEAIPPGPDVDRFKPRVDHPWRNKLLFAGRVHPNKGVEYAVRAVGLLPGYELVIAGAADPRYQRKLEALVDELGVTSRVAMLGDQRPRLCEVYAEADVLLFTSVWKEPWGLVPLEAMAVGTPVVASSVGGAAEYLRDGVNALVVPPRDEAALREAVARLSGDPALRKKLVEGGFTTAVEHSYHSALQRTAAVVCRAAAGRKAAPGEAPC